MAFRLFLCEKIAIFVVDMASEEACRVLKITKRTLQQYRDDGVIPFIALLGKMLYRESDLRAALEKNYVASFAHRNAEDFPAVYGRR